MATRPQHRPLGPGGTYKTGQRVPFTAFWVDQFGTVTHYTAGTTFLSCHGRRRECAYRKPLDQNRKTA